MKAQLSKEFLRIKDKLGNQMTFYQAKNGGIFLLFGKNAVALTLEQLKHLGICSDLYDIEGFSMEDYNKYYSI